MLVVGANLATDRTLRMARLVPGSVQRPVSAVMTAGGKAVNVCRASTAHGVRPRLVANLPGFLGAHVGDLLAAEGHDVRAVATSGEIRAATIIIEDDLRTTVLNEPGPDLNAVDRAALLAAVVAEFAHHRVVVLTGSLPPGAEQGFYAEVIDLAHAHGVRVVLDAARAALAAALPHGPDVVTPNLAEAQGVLTGGSVESVEPDSADVRHDAMTAARDLCSAGARVALVTAGRHGVALSVARSEERSIAGYAEGIGGTTHWIAAPEVREVNAIGAGDSFVAGLAVGLDAGEDLRAATLRAVATGAASVASPLAGHVEPGLLRELHARLVAAVATPVVRGSSAARGLP